MKWMLLFIYVNAGNGLQEEGYVYFPDWETCMETLKETKLTQSQGDESEGVAMVTCVPQDNKR